MFLWLTINTDLFILFRFNRRGKKQDRHILEQGAAPPKPPVTASSSLPPPLQKPANLPTKNKGDTHQFILPPNTAGTAKLRKRRVQTTPPAVPTPPPMQESVTSPPATRVVILTKTHSPTVQLRQPLYLHVPNPPGYHPVVQQYTRPIPPQTVQQPVSCIQVPEKETTGRGSRGQAKKV